MSRDPVIGTARVTVYHEYRAPLGGPDDAAFVESFDAAGHLVATSATAASGTTTIGITRGGSITVTHEVVSLWTFVGVEDGDDLVVRGAPAGVRARGSMFTTLPPVAAASTYAVDLPSADEGRIDRPAFFITVPESASPTFPLFIEVQGSDGTQLGFWAQETTFRDGATIELGPPTPFGALDLTLVHVSVDPFVRMSAGVDSWLMDNPVHGQKRAFFAPDASPIDLGLAYPPGFGDRHTLELSLTRGHSSIAMSVPIETSTNRTSVDVAKYLTPWLEACGPTHDGALSWSESGDQPYDGARFDLEFARGFSGHISWFAIWTVIAPRGSHPRFPHPEILSDQDSVGCAGQLVEDSQFDGYADFRNNRRHLDVPPARTSSTGP